jgi:hypothetical protein
MQYIVKYASVTDMLKSTKEKPDTIPLYDLGHYEIEETIYTASFAKSIGYIITFYFHTYLGANMFYQQFRERYIPKNRQHTDFQFDSSFSIEFPFETTQYNDAGIKLVAVRCSCLLNEHNQFGPIIKSVAIQDFTDVNSATKVDSILCNETEKLLVMGRGNFNFVHYINSYFNFPKADEVRLVYNPERSQNLHFHNPVFVNSQSFEPTKTYFPMIKHISPTSDPSNYTAVAKRIANTFCAPGLPLEQMQWPYHRRYKPDYITLLAQQNKRTLEKGSNVDEFLLELPSKPKIIELGAGAGYAVSDIKRLCPDARIIAVGITPLDHENIAMCDEVYYTFIPDNLALLQQHFGTADAVIDVFGPSTYAYNTNTIHVLIYAYCLLKRGGKFRSIVSGLDDSPHTFDSCPLGSGKNRNDLCMFFDIYLDSKLIIKKTKVRSRLKPGKLVQDFYFEFTRASNARDLVYDNFIDLCKHADKVLGIPYELDITSNSNYGQFKTQAIKSIFFKRKSTTTITKIEQNLSRNAIPITEKDELSTELSETSHVKFTAEY